MTMPRLGVDGFRWRPGATVGDVLACTDPDGTMEPIGGLGGGHWEPVTHGDPDTPEMLFSNGDVVMTWVED